MKDKSFIGFPNPLLGTQSLRLQVLYDDGQLLALAKPFDVLVQAESWYPQLPVLIEAIRYQAAAGKPEFKNLNIAESGLWAITDLDPEIHGPVLFARDRDVATSLKNEVGSGQAQFTYTFITSKQTTEDTMQCELPLSRHRHEKRILVSHTTGKKASTDFRRIEDRKHFAVWEAKAALPRRHQLLIHPFELGIPVLGDLLYARDKPLLLSRFKKNYQMKIDVDERPLYPGPACYLKQIQFADGVSIDCPQPVRWGGLVKQLEKYRS